MGFSIKKRLILLLVLVSLLLNIQSASAAVITGPCPSGCDCYDDYYCVNPTIGGCAAGERGDACDTGYECTGNECVFVGIKGDCPVEAPCYNSQSCKVFGAPVDCAGSYLCIDVEGTAWGGYKGKCVAPLKIEIISPSSVIVADKTCPFTDGSCSVVDITDYDFWSDCTTRGERGRYFSNFTSPMGSGVKDCVNNYESCTCTSTTSCTCDGCEQLKVNTSYCALIDIEIEQINTLGYDTLIRLYEFQRNITVPFKIISTSSDTVELRNITIDCSPFICSLVGGFTLTTIAAGADASFSFSMYIDRRITEAPFNYGSMPSILNHTLNPTILVNFSYPGYPTSYFSTKTKNVKVTLVDQDWSKKFCQEPNSAETGILAGTQGNLPVLNWLIGEDDGYFSLGDNSYKACCGDDLIEDTWSNPLYHNIANFSCYNSTTLSNCQQPDNKRVVNENGTLFLCNADVDTPTGQTLTKSDYCEFKCWDTLFCAYNANEWYNTQGRNRRYSKSWTDTIVDYPTECCEQDKCWNTSECVGDASGDVSPGQNIYEGDRCINGNWKESNLVYTPGGETAGYCPEDNQCLVSLTGDPQCISKGQYIGDDYCDDWTSRTKFIALQLLELPTNDYTLFCGNYEEVLNFLGYTVSTGLQGSPILAESYALETNNYCVLIYDNKIIFGTSLNHEIDEDDYTFSFIDIISIDNCDNAMIDDGYYHQCSADNVWYNKNLKSVIYSRNSIALSAINLSAKSNELNNSFSALINKLNGAVTPPYDYSFTKDFTKFRNLYTHKQGSKFILGAIEGSETLKNIVIRYDNINTDICGIINTYNQYHSDSVSGIVCTNENNNYYVLAQGGLFTTLKPTDIWPDLTAKLRVT